MDSTSQLLMQPAPPARPQRVGPDLDSSTAAQALPSPRSAGATVRPRTAIFPLGIVQLQRSAGNAAVARLLTSQSTVSRTTVQRCGSIPPDQCPCHDTDDTPTKAETPTAQRDVAVQRDDDDEEEGSGGVLDYIEKKGEAVVDAVAGAASSTAEMVSGAASSTAEAVSDAASAAADAVSGAASSAYDSASSAASSAVDTVSDAASALGDAVSDEVQAAKEALGAYLEGKTAEAVALFAKLQSQLATLATMIIPADKLAELNGHIASVNSLGAGLVSLPSIGGTAGGEVGEAGASPGAVSGLLASLQSAMQNLSSSASSSAKSPPVQRLVSEAAMIAFEEAEAAGTIAIEVEAIPAVVLAPETVGISIPVALAIAAAIAVVAGLIGYAVYRYTHPEKRPWGPADEATYSQLQQLEPTIAGRSGVDYSVKPADVLADPAKSTKWDECVALHEKYDPTAAGAKGTKQQFAEAATDIAAIKAKIEAGTATSDDYNRFCELLRARIKLAEQLASERFDYVAHGCDDLPWPVAPGETPKTPDERRKGHVDAFESALAAMTYLL
jgi:hypothetical protein